MQDNIQEGVMQCILTDAPLVGELNGVPVFGHWATPAECVAYFKAAKKLTLQELADIVGCKVSTAQAKCMRKPKRSWTWDEAARLCRYYRVKIVI
jgi:hypothetical protein